MTDDEMLASITAGELLQFRALQFPPAFITANPGLFLNLDWVHPVPLRAFLMNRDASTTQRSVATVKQEPSVSIRPEPRVKTEDFGMEIIDLTSPPRPSRTSTARTRPTINNHPEIIELPSSEDELEVEASLQPSGASSNPPDASELFTLSDLDSEAEPEVPAVVALSTTVWGDVDFISRAIDGPATINRQSKVVRVEYLNDIPSFLPVPRNKTAFILDLRDPKFDFADADGVLLRAHTLILNKNQESWDTSGSSSEQVTNCSLFNGEPVKCRRTRHTCRGCFRCSELNVSLVNVTRYELDPTSRADIISAEVATRMASGDTPEKLAAAFFRVITSEARKCKAKDSIGAPCEGHPIMKARINGTLRKGSFIACSEWTPTWRTHQSDSIPDNVSEMLLSQLMSPQAAFSSGSNTEQCSRIISARVGLRQQFCAHIHLANGKSIRGNMIHHPCFANMLIYEPIDTTLRMACVVFDHTKPHTHPMPVLAKLTLDVEKTYRKCVKAAGVLGTTVQKVDDAPTTFLLLKGQSPAMFHPSLHLKRRKQGIILSEKLIASPAGLGIGGVYARHVQNLKLPPESQYIHSVVTTPDGRVLIITMVPYLANLVHVARTVQVDTTFGRTVGDLNEWEFVIWYGSVERVLTVGRVYTDGADRPHYKHLFDELQRIIFRLTGKHLRFKRFTRGGNLITTGVDLEAAQVQGASDSFLPTNEPEYSGITTDDPDEFAMYYVRACISHAKRVHGLKRYVTDEVFKRLMDFPYLKTEEQLAEFTAWIGTLKIKKVQDRWKHKLQYPWIRPSLIKTLSRIHPDDWDITDASTNLNEGQHHWTNQQTGVHLTILEAIETARKVDFKTAREVQDSLETGLLDNNSNNMLHRMGRNVQRKSNNLAKQRAATQKSAETEELQAEVDAEKAAKKVQDQKVKNAQSALSAAKGKSTRRRRGAAATQADPLLEASSSGRVLSPRRRARPRAASIPSDAVDVPDIDEVVNPTTVVVPELPFPDLPPPPTPVDSTQTLTFTGDLAWLETFQFGTDVSQLDAVAPAVPERNMLPDDNARFDTDTEFTWFLANLANGADDFASTTPIPPATRYNFAAWNGGVADYFGTQPSNEAGGSVFEGAYTEVGSISSELPTLPHPPSSPGYPASSSPGYPSTPIEALNADVDERNIVHSARPRNPPKRMLENLPSSNAKKPKSKR